MTYVDGSMAAIPTANKDKFLEHAKIVADVLKEAGALQVVGCWGDDIPEGKETSMPMAVKKKDDETVLFSWITWPDKATRDAGLKKMIEDTRVQPDVNPMPYDGSRSIFGGFEMILES